jgi:hypothetical protein
LKPIIILQLDVALAIEVPMIVRSSPIGTYWPLVGEVIFTAWIFAAVPVDILFANVPGTGLVWAVTVTDAEVENPITRATAIEVINIVLICYIRLFNAVMEFPLLNFIYCPNIY